MKQKYRVVLTTGECDHIEALSLRINNGDLIFVRSMTYVDQDLLLVYPRGTWLEVQSEE